MKEYKRQGLIERVLSIPENEWTRDGADFIASQGSSQFRLTASNNYFAVLLVDPCGRNIARYELRKSDESVLEGLYSSLSGQ